MTLKAILFDLDGTLLDTCADFTTALNKQLQRHQRPTLGYHEVRQKVSSGARAMVELGFGISEGEAGFEDLRQEFLALYHDNLADQTSLFDGMAEILQFAEQSALSWGIVTNKPSEFTDPLLQQIGLAQSCGVAICPDHVSNRKPHPEPIYLACQKLSVAPHEAIYVGDHLRDIEAGRNAGMQTVACRYGYIDADDNIEEWGADLIIDHASELLEIIQRRLS